MLVQLKKALENNIKSTMTKICLKKMQGAVSYDLVTTSLHLLPLYREQTQVYANNISKLQSIQILLKPTGCKRNI